MGTRRFHSVEQKDSRIKWERADAETTRKIILALKKNRYGLWVRLLTGFPFVIFLALLLGFLVKIFRNPDLIDTASMIFSAFCFTIIFVVYLVRYIKLRPYLYLERQSGIWIFRAKCADINIILRNSGRERRYYAYFQKGGIHISIPIRQSVHKANPKGEEYIFYKFNNRTGNRWAALAAHELDLV